MDKIKSLIFVFYKTWLLDDQDSKIDMLNDLLYDKVEYYNKKEQKFYNDKNETIDKLSDLYTNFMDNKSYIIDCNIINNMLIINICWSENLIKTIELEFMIEDGKITKMIMDITDTIAPHNNYDDDIM
jgi:hypothetical protein